MNTTLIAEQSIFNYFDDSNIGFMTKEDFEKKCVQEIEPNELSFFNRIQNSIPEDYRGAFVELLRNNNTVLASYRAAPLVSSLANQLKCTVHDVAYVLPQFIHLYSILNLNRIELGDDRALNLFSV